MTWASVKNDFSNTDAVALAFDKLGSLYLGTSSTGGTAQGVYNCINGGITCVQMNSGFPVLPNIYDFAYGGEMLYAGTNIGVWQYQVVALPTIWLYLPVILRNP